MIVPLIDGIIDFGCNGEISRKGNISRGSLSIAEEYTVIDCNNGTIAGCKLCFTGNFLAGNMVNTIPGPQTYRQAHQSLFTGQGAVIGSGDGKRNHIFNRMNITVHTVGYDFAVCIQQNILHFVARSHDHLIQFPGIGGVQLNIGLDINYSFCSCGLDVHIVNRIIFGHFTGIVVSIQIHDALLTVYRNCELAGNLHIVAQIVRDFKGNRVCAISQSQVIGSHHLASGHRGVHGIAIQENLRRSGVESGCASISNCCTESCAAGGNNYTIFQCGRCVTCCILNARNGGQNAVIHSGGVV